MAKFRFLDDVEIDGDLMLGDSTHSYKVGVNGNVAIGASYAEIENVPADGLIVKGQVGINTPTPDAGYALHVNGKAKFLGDLEYEGDIIQDSMITYTATDTTDGHIVIEQGNESDEVPGTVYTLKDNYHALSNGPIKIADGITVTIPENTQWKII